MGIESIIDGLNKITANKRLKKDLIFLVRVAYAEGYNDACDHFLRMVVEGDPSGMNEAIIGLSLVLDEMEKRAKEDGDK